MIHKPKYKTARRLGAHIFEKTQTQKFALRGASVGPARMWKRGKSRSDFANKMIEKQKARTMYGVGERQFSNYISAILAVKGGNRLELLVHKLESRLDNVVFRLGLAPTRQASRQMVSHGHIAVNGRRITIPSFEVSVNDVITIPERSQKKPLFAGMDEKMKKFTPPAWLSFDLDKKQAKIQGAPKLTATEIGFDIPQIFEFYTR